MQFPGLIDSHADEKDYELAFHLGRHTGTNYLCHGVSSAPHTAYQRLRNESVTKDP